MSYRNVFQNDNVLNQSPQYNFSGRINPDNLSALSAPYEISQQFKDPTTFPQSLPMDPNMAHILRMQGINRGNIDYSMTDKITDGLGTFKNTVTDTFGNFKNTVSGGLENILNNTMIGRVMAGFDATNPNAFNYNPELQGQIDFLKSQGQYGVMDPSGLNKITSGVLKGKNLQSAFGSNDLTTMYEKELARATGVLEGLPDQWSQLAASKDEEDIAAYKKKLDFHREKVARIKQEQAEAAAAAQAAAEAQAAASRAESARQYNPNVHGPTNYGLGSDGQQSYDFGQGFGVGATTGGPVSNKTGRGRTDYMYGGLASIL